MRRFLKKLDKFKKIGTKMTIKLLGQALLNEIMNI